MTIHCHNCAAPIADLYHARGEHFRGVTRWWCGDLQGCGERAVALRLGVSVAEQRARMARIAAGVAAAVA